MKCIHPSSSSIADEPSTVTASSPIRVSAPWDGFTAKTCLFVCTETARGGWGALSFLLFASQPHDHDVGRKCLFVRQERSPDRPLAGVGPPERVPAVAAKCCNAAGMMLRLRGKRLTHNDKRKPLRPVFTRN